MFYLQKLFSATSDLICSMCPTDSTQGEDGEAAIILTVNEQSR